MTQSLVGKIIDNYQITGVLGEGGMGVVYKARNLQLEKDVALKMMDASLARDESFLKRFRSEAKSLARLQNPNIVTVYDLRETAEGICIIMEYVEGGTLADRIRESGPLPLVQVFKIFRQILPAVGHAHQAGVIHRDIKPSNILLTAQDVVKVTDFGLAKIQEAVAVTVTLATGGTLYYMSPEQVRGLGNVDHRGDIYSLGMTLYETVTGSLPFKKTDSPYAIEKSIVEGKVPSPDQMNPSVPKGLSRVVAKAIDKDPDRRFQSATEMWEAMERVEERDHPPKALPAGRRPRKLRPLVYGLAVGVIAVALVVLYTLLNRPSKTILTLDTIPSGSIVSLDGTVIGTSPFSEHGISPGRHEIRVSRPDYETKDTSIFADEGKGITLSLTLLKNRVSVAQGEHVLGGWGSKEETAGSSAAGKGTSAGTSTLILRVIPRGSIAVDGRPVPNAGGKPSQMQVTTGQRSVEFSYPGYGSKKLAVNLSPGQTRSLTCYFTWSINIVANPTWAMIIVDGKNIQKETPSVLSLGPGKHTITVRREGYETLGGSKEIVVEPTMEERVIRLPFELQKK